MKTALVAHGETVGIKSKMDQAPDGAKAISDDYFLPPRPGLEICLNDQPQFHCGLLSAAPPALGLGGFDAHANGWERIALACRTMGSQLGSLLIT